MSVAKVLSASRVTDIPESVNKSLGIDTVHFAYFMLPIRINVGLGKLPIIRTKFNITLQPNYKELPIPGIVDVFPKYTSGEVAGGELEEIQPLFLIAKHSIERQYKKEIPRVTSSFSENRVEWIFGGGEGIPNSGDYELGILFRLSQPMVEMNKPNLYSVHMETIVESSQGKLLKRSMFSQSSTVIPLELIL